MPKLNEDVRDYEKTGEHRLPKRGEYFITDGEVWQADEDFFAIELDIAVRKQYFDAKDFEPTGEHRLPKNGEYYRWGDTIYRSDHDSVAVRYPIYRRKSAVTDEVLRLVEVKGEDQPVFNVGVSSRSQASVLAEVADERRRQDKKWGVQNHNPILWSAILGEEFGEFTRAALEARAANPLDPLAYTKWMANLRQEAVQVAAVATAIVESLDRDEWVWPGAQPSESFRD